MVDVTIIVVIAIVIVVAMLLFSGNKEAKSSIDKIGGTIVSGAISSLNPAAAAAAVPPSLIDPHIAHLSL